MNHHSEHCPTCGRAFKSIMDYPLVSVLSFERLPTPEAVDHLSAAAAEKTLARRRKRHAEPETWRDQGINKTPEIANACQRPEVVDYLAQLAALIGRQVAPRELLPGWKASGYFKRAYPIADTGLFLCLDEEANASEEGRTAQVEVYCDGPNMGSAGGPTLLQLGAIARLHYQGLLM